MSTTTTPNDSPIGTPIQPLHNPSQAAHVVVPQAPLGNSTNGPLNQAPGMGAKALLAKKFAKSQYVPCSRSIEFGLRLTGNLATRPMCRLPIT